MTNQIKRVLLFKNLKLKLINSYRKDGREGIIKILEENGQIPYLKRHHQLEPTVLLAENMCKQWIHEELITNQN